MKYLLISAIIGSFLLTSFQPKTVSGGGDEKQTQKTNYELAHEVRVLFREHMNDGPTEKFFSRCPSGYQAHLRDDLQANFTKEAGYEYGKVYFYESCDGKEICYFRVNVAKQTYEVASLDSPKWMKAMDWIYANKKSYAKS